MFVETWGHRHVNFHVPNFQYFELNRTIYKSSTKRSSGGIIIYIRESLIKPDSVVLLTKESDDIIWLRLDDTASLKDDVFLCLCYNLPSGTSRQTITEDNIFDRISSYMVHLQSLSDKTCKFIICGDMNARVADMNDFVSNDASRYVFLSPMIMLLINYYHEALKIQNLILMVLVWSIFAGKQACELQMDGLVPMLVSGSALT